MPPCLQMCSFPPDAPDTIQGPCLVGCLVCTGRVRSWHSVQRSKFNLLRRASLWNKRCSGAALVVMMLHCVLEWGLMLRYVLVQSLVTTHVKSQTDLEEMFNVQQLLGKECLLFVRQKSKIIFEHTGAVITVFHPSLFNIWQSVRKDTVSCVTHTWLESKVFCTVCLDL